MLQIVHTKPIDILLKVWHNIYIKNKGGVKNEKAKRKAYRF